MKRALATLLTVASLWLATGGVLFAADFQVFDLWPGAAPGETGDAEKPTCRYLKPDVKTSDACVIGVPRREGAPKHLAPWQDAQRCVRFVRARAEEWGINPEKIGILGFSAGGHLTLMTATSSLTNSYEPVDDIDKLSASVAFAVPIYPAYVLEDGADGPNVAKGNDSTMVEDFAFDEKTPPMCLFHGDADAYSPMGSVAVYAKLRQKEIPAELHIFAGIKHGFVGHAFDDHVGSWPERTLAWMQTLGF